MLHHVRTHAHKHFPTFIQVLTGSWQWYRSRDMFEQFVISFLLLGGITIGAFQLFLSAPPDFPAGAYARVLPGASLKTIADDFTEQGFVRDAFLLRLMTRILGNDRVIPAGEYYFPRRENMLSVAIRLVSGDFQTTLTKVTIPEGSTNADIVRLLTEKLPEFDRSGFIAATRGKEGYLFPDTYYFMPGETTEAILSVFNNSLQAHLAKIQKQISASKRPLDEILTMASILEKEAWDFESQRVIAGVFWRRIEIGMPLQTDAVFPYIMGKNTFQLTREDLRVDSPYNTHINKGLPPGPIGNPGISAILAAVTPVKTNYLFFLSDHQGNFHFAKTYEEHLRNKQKYLGT